MNRQNKPYLKLKRYLSKHYNLRDQFKKATPSYREILTLAAHHFNMPELSNTPKIERLNVIMKLLPEDHHFDLLKSQSWKILRYKILKKNNGLCELCGRGKKDNMSLHVDHIKPRSLYPELALDPDNLQVLCKDCNFGKGNRDEIDWR